MSLNAEQTLAKSAGDLLLAPYPQVAPSEDDLATLATLETAGWTHMGWLSEDGPEPDGFEGENTKHYGWNAVAPIRSTTRVREPMIPVSLLQWNSVNLGEFFPGSSYDVSSNTVTIPESGNPAEQALLLRIADGDEWYGIWVAKVTARAGGSFTFPGDGLSEIPLIYDILSTGDDDNYMKVIGVLLDNDASDEAAATSA